MSFNLIACPQNFCDETMDFDAVSIELSFDTALERDAAKQQLETNGYYVSIPW